MTIKEPSSTIAFFDFDDTLIKGDALWPFLVAVAGWPRTLYALGCALIANALRRSGTNSRTFIKAFLLGHLLRGKKIEDLSDAIAKLRLWMHEKSTANVLREHYAAGHHVVIVSGSLNLYLPFLLDNLPHHAVLCTEIGIENNVITGAMTNGNCVREHKAEIVATYMAEHGPFEQSWAYGNFPHDVPMMQHVQYRVLVS